MSDPCTPEGASCVRSLHTRGSLCYSGELLVELSGDTESRRKERNITILVGKSSDGGELRVPWEGARQETLGLSLEGQTAIGQRKTGKWTLVRRNNRGRGL